MNLLSLRHDVGLALAALVVCAAASFGVFRIRARLRGTHDSVRNVWLFLAGVEAGAGIWGAQMLGMLALDPGVPSGYAPLGMVATLLLAVGGSALAFAMAWTSQDRTRQATGGVLFALTVSGVHYCSLEARPMAATLGFEPIVVWLSVVGGVVLASSAMLAGGAARRLGAQIVGAALLAGSIVLVHVVGAAATTLTPDHALSVPPGLLDRTAMLFIAGMLSAIMIGAGLGAAYIDDTSSRRAVARLQRLADATREGIAILGDDRRIQDCNAAFSGLCGRSQAEVRGLDLWSLITLEDEAQSCLDRRQDAHMLAAGGASVPVGIKLSFVADHAGEGRPGLIATVTDLREQRAAEARIRFLNEHDTVTGLPNRAVLVGRLEEAMARLREGAGSVMMVNVRVTNSQEINSLHGHVAGDALLSKVGERLKRLVGEAGLAARLGGNEFAFFVKTDINAGDAAAQVFFARMTTVLRRAFVWNAQPLEPQVRIGVAAAPHDSATAAELMMHAESAQRARDADTVEGVAYFRRDLHEALAAQRSLAADLRKAIAADELTVFYQPQARSQDGALCGFEALVRWRHPEHGMLPPDRFIPVAEENGLIEALGEWVLRRACRDAVGWPKAVPVAVNLSPLQIGEADLPRRVHEILIETGLSPGRLELEITETALFRDYQRALDVLRRLKALGIRIAMDDFGTGFSSLSTLQSFPFDKIKIDKSFVAGVGKLERSTVIVKAVLGIGRGLAIPVVAEGVETEEQMAFLRDEMCATVQGYLIGKPGPVDLHEAMFQAAPAPSAVAAPAPARKPRRKAA